jgi:hypothetical protein
MATNAEVKNQANTVAMIGRQNCAIYRLDRQIVIAMIIIMRKKSAPTRN